MRSLKTLFVSCLFLTILLITSCKKDDPPTSPIVKTTIISEITQSTATGGGEIEDNGGAPVTKRGICWGTTNSPTISGDKTTDGTGDGSFISRITGLTPGNLYYVRAYAANSVGTGYGKSISFNTNPVALAEINTTGVTDITPSSAKSGGTIVSSGGAEITACGVCWSMNHEPKITDNKTTDVLSVNSFSSTLTNLEYFKTYYVRAYATNSAGTVYGNEREFKTAAIPPTVTTSEITNRTYRTATAGGEVISDGGSPVTDRGICFATHIDPKSNENNLPAGSGIGSFTVEITGLTPNTEYHVRAYAATAADTAYGVDVSFKTTELSVPVVTTKTVIWNGEIFSEAITGGEVISDGGSPITERGVCWSTTGEPTVNDRHTIDGSGIGNFNSMIPGMELFPPQDFHVRAYAKNSFGIGYGADQSFFSFCMSYLYQVEASNITGTSAKISCIAGNFEYVRFVITNTLTGSQQTIPGGVEVYGGPSQVSITVSGLTIGTLYTVDALSEGVCNQMGPLTITFTTLNSGTVSDIEGNIYTTKRIGTQIWMTENLKATKYSNGNLIPNVPDINQWMSLEEDGYCWYDNNASSYKDTYGALYNWYTVNKGNLCPTGWHVPTDAEWGSLETYLGGISIAGGKLKEEGTMHWQTPNNGATNESGFTGLPGGYRDLNGAYNAIGRYGEWWTSTGDNNDAAWDRHLVNDIISIVRSSNDLNDGFSVRCIQDNLK